MIRKLQENININSSRIYISGLSRGALMTYRLGAELSDIVAAIAPDAGIMDYKSEITKNNPLILQARDTFNAIFPLKAPENNESQWILKLYVTTIDGYSWTFDIVYELLETQQYHLLS